MKKYYCILIFIIMAVIAVFSSSFGAKINSLPPAIQGLAMLAFILPTCLLLYLISKDNKIKKGYKKAAKFGIVFLIFCFIAGVLAEFVY